MGCLISGSISQVRENWTKRLQATPGCTSLEGECHQVMTCVEIALRCINADRKQRPEIVKIIDWLNETEQKIEKLAMRQGAVSHPDKVRRYRHKCSCFVFQL